MEMFVLDSNDPKRVWPSVCRLLLLSLPLALAGTTEHYPTTLNLST